MADLEDVYCSVVLTDGYLPGAAVLAHSLRDSDTNKKLACLILQDSLRPSTIEELQSLYNYVIPIERIGNPQPANLYLMNRPDLLYTFTKLHLWRLTQFRKIVYIDADVLALRAPEELFDIEEPFAAAPDVGWPDCFNTGVMVISPHMGDYHALRNMASAGDSFDGGDQGLINQYYEHRPWKRISFTYNTTPSANYQYEPAYRYYKRDVAMVHFIGREKPWQRARSAQGSPSAFQEMLSRWWAVYDRHFRVSTDAYIAGQRNHVRQRSEAQQNVSSSTSASTTTHAAMGYPIDTTQPAPPPQSDASHHQAPDMAGSTTPPMTEPGEPAENIDQGHTEPTPTTEQRRFSAPHMEWDATRAAPPTTSRPEAANFPSQTYEFTSDPAPFRAPSSYPEPPRDMWYEVPAPAPKEEKLKPLFPWEEREVRKPSRRFVEDEAPPSPPQPEAESRQSYTDELEVSDNRNAPSPPAIQVNDESPWVAFGQSRNVWDDDKRINNYVRALTAFQKQRGNVQVVSTNVPSTATQTHVLSPSNVLATDNLIEAVRERRESLILTDFPTAMERPSLPVTPAPRRRPAFWGSERDTGSDLPAADGVPDQADWDPSMQLDELRRSSLIGPSDLKLPDRELPKRSMPTTAEPMISGNVLNRPHVPITDTRDGGNDEDMPRKNAQLDQALDIIVPSGGSSPHGLDQNYSFRSETNHNRHTADEPEFSPLKDSTSGRIGITRNMSETELNTALNSGSVPGIPGDFEGSVAPGLKQQTPSLFTLKTRDYL